MLDRVAIIISSRSVLVSIPFTYSEIKSDEQNTEERKCSGNPSQSFLHKREQIVSFRLSLCCPKLKVEKCEARKLTPLRTPQMLPRNCPPYHSFHYGPAKVGSKVQYWIRATKNPAPIRNKATYACLKQD